MRIFKTCGWGVSQRSCGGRANSPNGALFIRGIWGSSDASLWVAAVYRIGSSARDYPAIFRFDGTWTMIPTSAQPLAVTGPSTAGDAMAVGVNGLTATLSGTAVTENAHVTGNLVDIQGTGSDNLWMVGGPEFCALHWDGAVYDEYSIAGGVSSYFSVCVTPDNDVWAGAPNANGAFQHFNGTSFINSPATANSIIRYFWGLSSSMIWAGTNGSSIYSYDGNSWQAVSQALASSSVAFQNIWASSATDLWLSGTGGITEHWNGSAWAVNSVPDSTASLIGLWGADASHVWTSGSNGVIYGWDGSNWSTQLTAKADLGKMHGCTASDIWGTRRDASTILQFDGANWTESSTGTRQPTRSVWCAAPDDAWAVGSGSSVIRHRKQP